MSTSLHIILTLYDVYTSSGLSKEELERRRKEMMEDAESHGRKREQRLRRLERDYQREEKESVSSHSKDFLQ